MIRPILSIAIAASLAGSASAILNFNIDAPQAFTTAPGTSVTFTGTVTGVTGDLSLANTFLENARTSTGSIYLQGQFTPSFLAYLSLTTTANYVGSIASYTIPVGTPAGLYATNAGGSGAQIVVGGLNSRGKLVQDNEFFEINVQAVPEPSGWAALGLGAFGLMKRRKKA